MFAAMLLLGAGMLLAGCSAVPNGSAHSSGAEAADAAPQESVRIGGITYVRGNYGQGGTIPAKAVDQRTLVGKVKEQAAGYNLGEGQATRLGSGTPLYAMCGYNPSFRVAAREARQNDADEAGGAWALYEVESNPGAEGVDDLLNIKGKVGRIDLEVFITDDGKPAKRESFSLGPEESADVVDVAQIAPLRRVSSLYSKGLLTFHLEDGTRSIRVYDPYSGELFLSENQDWESGVVLPGEYRRLLMPAS